MPPAVQTVASTTDQRAIAVTSWQPVRGLDDSSPIKIDYLEAGYAGPVVILVHPSVSGARQWRRMMDDLTGC